MLAAYAIWISIRQKARHENRRRAARRENAGGSRLRRRAASRRFYADLRAHPAAEKRASRKRPRQAAPARDKIRVGFQLTPARGRKLNTSPSKSEVRYFNSPPHGDGNPISIGLLVWKLFQLTPARGRKQVSFITPSGSNVFQLTPARGRKRNMLFTLLFLIEFQLTPARGRKLI